MIISGQDLDQIVNIEMIISGQDLDQIVNIQMIISGQDLEQILHIEIIISSEAGSQTYQGKIASIAIIILGRIWIRLLVSGSDRKH